ncbi:hypothetical protein A4X03_0g9838, partial [Tilletia caries]
MCAVTIITTLVIVVTIVTTIVIVTVVIVTVIVVTGINPPFAEVIIKQVLALSTPFPTLAKVIVVKIVTVPWFHIFPPPVSASCESPPSTSPSLASPSPSDPAASPGPKYSPFDRVGGRLFTGIGHPHVVGESIVANLPVSTSNGPALSDTLQQTSGCWA